LADESWLPPPSTVEAGPRRPWEPEDLRGSPPERLSYVVVEEMIEDSVGLNVCGWPDVDESGRLSFTQPSTLVRVERAWLERQLAEHRDQPPDVGERPLRIGDVFAMADVELGEGEESELTITKFEPPIHDITAEGRTAAKTALYGALAPVLDPNQADEIRELVEEPDL
jgi:hypothetical protein